MFDIGWTELVVITAVRDRRGRPERAAAPDAHLRHDQARANMANDFQRQFDEAVREAELDEVRQP